MKLPAAELLTPMVLHWHMACLSWVCHSHASRRPPATFAHVHARAWTSGWILLTIILHWIFAYLRMPPTSSIPTSHPSFTKFLLTLRDSSHFLHPLLHCSAKYESRGSALMSCSASAGWCCLQHLTRLDPAFPWFLCRLGSRGWHDAAAAYLFAQLMHG